MLLAQSSFPIKSWPTKGTHCKKILGILHSKVEANCHNIPTKKRAHGQLKDASNSTLAFNVRRSEPELVIPTRPTPNKPKLLSDLDAQDLLLYQQSAIWFYPGVENMKDKDPAEVIKNALAEALVYYYPWAGRLRDAGPFQKHLTVDCTAEGVVFVEADADISLEELREKPLLPPFPYLEEVLYNKAASTMDVFGFPLLTMQVTRLSCGGFILALSFNHTMTDGFGLVQLLTAIGELAKGASAPSVLPVWQRNLLNGSDHCQYLTPNKEHAPVVGDHNNMVCRTFSFSAHDVATLRARMPRHLRLSTAFELITGALWRCRTIALQLDPKEEICVGFVLTARTKFSPSIPLGYYGITFTLATAVSTARNIYDGPFSYTVEQLKKARHTATGEYKRSLIDPGLLRGQRFPMNQTSFLVSDLSQLQLSSVDFGWGKTMHCCPADLTPIPHILTFILPFRNDKGEDVKAVPVYLPEDVMERFAEALESLLKEQ